jgi:hypothetical protein
MRRLLAFVALLWLLSVGPVHAATIEVIQPRDAGSPALIVVHGTLRHEDIQDFNFKLGAVSKALVVLQSDGGSLIAGIRIGRFIRLRSVSTLVPDKGRCASACAIAWLGGATRYMGASAQIGFHAAYRDEGGVPIETGEGNAILGAYLNQIGLTEAAIAYITRAAPRSMTWLTMAEAARHNIDVQLFSSPTVALPAPPPVPVAPRTEPSVKPINPKAKAARVTITSVVGPPHDPQGARVDKAFSTALGRQGIKIVAQSSAHFHLTPYVLAKREQAGTRISYVLDVSDSAGIRRQRFAGEEIVPGTVGDPWAAISVQVAQALADTATENLAAWLNTQLLPNPQPRWPVMVTVRGVPLLVTVRGAPGDGNTSLRAALLRSLGGKDVALPDGSSSYWVEGAVTLRPVGLRARQYIEIEWTIKDPHGRRLGTVTQRNDIPEGSLDGSWGRVAVQAADSAAQGVLKLLPHHKSDWVPW